MGNHELKRLMGFHGWYLKDQLDFDKKLIYYRYKTLRPHLEGPEGLELGCADGQMTRYLVEHFYHLTIVDGSEELLNCIPNASNLTKVHSLFEEYFPEYKFNTIILEHILEHVDKPIEFLKRIKNWSVKGGKILIGVPNGLSFHRLVAVKMGILKHPCELNERDASLGHRRVYTLESLRNDIELAGLRIKESCGTFFKPLSNKQIQDHWNEQMIEGFYELGKDFPENAAELLMVCEA